MKVQTKNQMDYVKHNFIPIKNKLLNKYSPAETHFEQLLLDAHIYFRREKCNFKYDTRWSYFDYYLPYYKIYIEIDGASHNTEEQKKIDKEKLEWLCQASQVPLAMTVYSCPPLMMTRAVLPGEYGSKPFTDARGIKLCPAQEGPLTVLRPETGYDWRNLRNNLVKAAHIVVDARGAGRDAFAKSGNKQVFLFNYDRTLR